MSKHEKEEKQPFREKRAKPKLWTALDNSISHTHVQGPPTATCFVLNTYHNPTDFISSWLWISMSKT
jgi:hypothetical protein